MQLRLSVLSMEQSGKKAVSCTAGHDVLGVEKKNKAFWSSVATLCSPPVSKQLEWTDGTDSGENDCVNMLREALF